MIPERMKREEKERYNRLRKALQVLARDESENLGGFYCGLQGEEGTLNEKATFDEEPDA